jgi:DnaJ-class molecular chaperone
VTHRPRWIEVAKGDCRECGGYGVHRSAPSHWTKAEAFKSGYRCQACKGTGQRSVGYMDLRDASGR